MVNLTVFFILQIIYVNTFFKLSTLSTELHTFKHLFAADMFKIQIKRRIFMTKKIKKRSEIKEEYKWHINDLCESDEKWEV